ncbi:MAG: peptidoglycan editing factor PgeF [Lachnospiraceae bacterium]|nr:peptidoglycan editing factor PgeF [Lachnospiraceae bacterium]
MEGLKLKHSGSDMVRIEQGGMEILMFPALKETGIVNHMFSTRVGGVSEGIFSTMNFGFNRGDDPEHVRENYRRVANFFGHGSSLEDFVAGNQTHTVNVHRVIESDRGSGVAGDCRLKNNDGLITNVPGLILTTFHADCTPLFFVDPVRKAIGLSHSGWRGTAMKMAAVTLKKMKEEFGTEPSDCICGIGPSICGDCYEVGEDVAEAFRNNFDENVLNGGILRRGKAPGKYQLFLEEANVRILEEAGVPGEKILRAGICTSCNSSYLFSHRASLGRRGNMCAFMELNGL